jgi:hypothetical protein
VLLLGLGIHSNEVNGAGDGLRTRGLLRERISFLHDPLFSCDLKSAAFDRAWLLPQRYPVHRDSSAKWANDRGTLEFFGYM